MSVANVSIAEIVITTDVPLSLSHLVAVYNRCLATECLIVPQNTGCAYISFSLFQCNKRTLISLIVSLSQQQMSLSQYREFFYLTGTLSFRKTMAQAGSLFGCR